MAFSAAATSPVTRNGTSSARSADITASTTAPPVTSRFMVIMPSRGLSQSPPVSNVMPLPTSTTCGCARAAARRVPQLDQPRRPGRAATHAEDALEAVGGQRLLVPDPAPRAPPRRRGRWRGRRATAGDLSRDGQVATSRAAHPARPTTSPRRIASPWPSTPHSTTRPTGGRSGPAVRQVSVNEASSSPSTKACTHAPASAPSAAAGTLVATAVRPRASRARAAPALRRSPGVASPTPSSTSWRTRAGERVHGGLADPAGEPLVLRDPDQIHPVGGREVAGAGSEPHALAVRRGRSHRDGEDLDVPDGAERLRARDDLRGRRQRPRHGHWHCHGQPGHTSSSW